jgi:hypothetical protein
MKRLFIVAPAYTGAPPIYQVCEHRTKYLSATDAYRTDAYDEATTVATLKAALNACKRRGSNRPAVI